MATIATVDFVTKLQDCVKEYKKQMADTRDEQDAAFFFSPALKKFVKDHKHEFDILSTMKFEGSFITWLHNYLMKEIK